MKFTEKVVKELLQIRGIKHPKALFGRKKYKALMNFCQRGCTGVHLSSVHLYAKMLNVPASFIVRIFVLERRFGDETIN